jgi:hypothetical protein
VLLCTDWTLLRLFPPLRAAWALKGQQATVPITGANVWRDDQDERRATIKMRKPVAAR